MSGDDSEFVEVAVGDMATRRRVSVSSSEGVVLDAEVTAPVGAPQAVVVVVHGITADLDEGGMYVRLAERLAAVGLANVRFSFRGHGRSGGRSEKVSVAGEVSDLHAVTAMAVDAYPGVPLFVVAGSFGAVPTVLSESWLVDRGLEGVVLWNPVLDVRRTFLEPELPWGLANFNAEALARMRVDGFLTVDGRFRLGPGLFDEFETLEVESAFVAGDVPTLIVHGDRDTAVSYEIARRACARRRACVLHTVAGADHGFDDHDEEAVEVTVDWLAGRDAKRRHAR